MSASSSRFLTGVVPHILAIIVAAAGCVGVAYWAKDQVEKVALTDLRFVLSQSGHDWTEIAVDGLSVELSGTAPDEATRFAALSTAGTVVDASRIVDSMDVVAAAAIKAPDFAIEILKNQDGVSLIGLVPLVSDPEAIVDSVRAISGGAPVSELLETADFPIPRGWDIALAYGIEVLDTLPSSKLTVAPGALSIKAVAETASDRQRLERRLQQNAPKGVRVTLDIRAPRPVVAPFILRAVLNDDGGRFDACTADSEAARKAILDAGFKAGVSGGAACILGLGTPSTDWADAAVAGLDALQKIGGGTLTMSNADITLVAREGTSAMLFERAAGELESALPAVFSLATVLPVAPEAPEEGAKAPPEFIATRSPEGQVQLRGRLSDETMRAAVQSFAAAQFGADNVSPAIRLDADVPAGWPKRVMAALSSLGLDENAQGEIAGLLSSALGGAATFELDVTYREALDPLASIPTPEECIAMLRDAGAARKITFAPSSTEIEPEAQETIDKIAEILKDCQDAPIEIGGHTDSQGREIMNEQLSQARADAVLNAIMARRILVSNLTARGYGESQPIADNGTEEGREANRRIEFRLVKPDEQTETADASEEDAAAGGETEESTE